MKYLILIIFSLWSIFSFAQLKSYKVVGIIDGDTIEVLDLASNNNIRIRLAEIDCPEKGQNFGTKAKNYTSSQVFNKLVKINIIDTDRYGRSIAKVYYSNKYLSEELVKNGLAIVYRKYSSNQKLLDFQFNAKVKKLGIWSDSSFIGVSRRNGENSTLTI